MLLGGRVIVKTGAVDEMGVIHTQLLGTLIHFFHKAGFTAGNMLRHCAGAIVGRADGDGFYHIRYGHGFADLQVNLTAALGCGSFRGGNGVVPADLAAVNGFHNEKHGHHLGDAGRG